ncbi:hypothetical protein GCM10023196_069090 [Actinoallomurus vinaceus]|uniref:Major facilitator superfamily (MFS) profile domain-containing protein n=1 Tax=Actinoallomurus vinaceus TaxID=1080074 RepID=A0ABP8UJR3_9ACTN
MRCFLGLGHAMGQIAALGGVAGTEVVGWLDEGMGRKEADFLVMAVSLAAAALMPLLRARPAREVTA